MIFDLLRFFYPLDKKTGSLVALFSSLGALSYGFFEAQRPQVKTLTIKTPKVSSPIIIGIIKAQRILEEMGFKVLTGHTHGGQIFPFNLIVRLFTQKVRG